MANNCGWTDFQDSANTPDTGTIHRYINNAMVHTGLIGVVAILKRGTGSVMAAEIALQPTGCFPVLDDTFR
ncbi:hypothetical protein CI610_02569 [invertebrate metagenome]|uniref:Uncharacterized protein n=1 Tax=invertebrate metagenome TaxID=1711999 RepID=A0A2H9T5J4_9ZZZZ